MTGKIYQKYVKSHFLVTKILSEIMLGRTINSVNLKPFNNLTQYYRSVYTTIMKEECFKVC